MAEIKRCPVHFIDLGLSVRWNDRNICANYLGTGKYVSFGGNFRETQDGYLFAKGNYKSPKGEYAGFGQQTIVLTSNDSAHSYNLRMPTYNEVEELTLSDNIEWFVAFRLVEKNITNGIINNNNPCISFYHDKDSNFLCRVYKEIRVFLGKEPFACELNGIDYRLFLKSRSIGTNDGEVVFWESANEIEPFYLGACRKNTKNIYRYYCESKEEITVNRWYDNILTIPFSGIMKYNTIRRTNNIDRGILKNGLRKWDACFPCGSIDQKYAFYNIALFNYVVSHDGDKFNFDSRPYIAFSKTPWDGMNVRAVENTPDSPPRYY
ncbi:MAG: hypothetical protein IKB31_09700 [Bacteroidaceae bacterium]|nr:hypothetical protein [Bacteroidaceae bacterium]